MSEKASKPEAVKNPAPEKTNEAVYEVGEFARNAERLFGKKANADLVVAAFMVANQIKATLSEATDIVSKFMSKEVK